MENKYNDRIEWLIDRTITYTMADKKNLKNKSKHTETVITRYIVWYNLKNYTNLSLSRLGNIFNRDHATVLNGLRKYNNIIETGFFSLEKFSDFIYNAEQIEIEFKNKFPPIITNSNFYQNLSNDIFTSQFATKRSIGKILIR